MLYLFQSSQVAVPLWLAIVGPLIAASGTWLAIWVNRKRRSSVRAEDDRLAAEARNLEVQSISQLLKEIRETRAELEIEVQRGRERAEENRRQQSFLQGQLEWHEELSVLAREAAHAAINEIQRCVIAIHARDDVLNAEGLADKVSVFEQTAHKEIVKYQEFPLPPKRLSE